MNQTLHQYAADFCARLLGFPLSTLLAPINPAAPAGASLRADGVYEVIANARRADDNTLPMGGWGRELKRADWNQVSRVAVEALSHKGKDLQVAAWLLEAQIHKNGFAAMAPVLHVIQQLCHYYWDNLYPALDDDGLEHRANVFRWINEKLLPALRQVPLTSVALGPQYCYADWENARRQDQMHVAPKNQEGVSSTDLTKAIDATPTAFYVALDSDLNAALVALDDLTATIAPHFEGNAPSFDRLAATLQQIHALVGLELHDRGVAPAVAAEMEDARSAPAPTPTPTPTPIPTPTPPTFEDETAIRDRAHAYMLVELAASFLGRAEPHSPVPYLLRRAVTWGHMNADELYQELFLRMVGQFNILSDVMGLNVAEASDEA